MESERNSVVGSFVGSEEKRVERVEKYIFSRETFRNAVGGDWDRFYDDLGGSEES